MHSNRKSPLKANSVNNIHHV